MRRASSNRGGHGIEDYPHAIAKFIEEAIEETKRPVSLSGCKEGEASWGKGSGWCWVGPRDIAIQCVYPPRTAMQALLCLHEIGHAMTLANDPQFRYADADAREAKRAGAGWKLHRTYPLVLTSEAIAWAWAFEAWLRESGQVVPEAAAMYAVASMMGSYVIEFWTNAMYVMTEDAPGAPVSVAMFYDWVEKGVFPDMSGRRVFLGRIKRAYDEAGFKEAVDAASMLLPFGEARELMRAYGVPEKFTLVAQRVSTLVTERHERETRQGRWRKR